MRVTVRGKGVEITAAMENYVQEKAKSLIDKYFSDVDFVEIQGRMKISKASKLQLKHIAEISVHFHTYELRGQASTSDMYVSIDEAFKNIENQYIKHKERLSRKNNKSHAGMKEAGQELVEEEMEVIRRKTFTLKPMNEEEAIMQMDLLGHNFYVYLDDETDNIRVVYRRKEGQYGVIETQK